MVSSNEAENEGTMSAENIERLFESIYEITCRLNECLQEEQYQQMDELLSDRERYMEKIDQEIAKIENYQHSQKVRVLMENIFKIDQDLSKSLTSEKNKTKTALEQMNLNKKISKKFEPYNTQLNGVFLDARK